MIGNRFRAACVCLASLVLLSAVSCHRTARATLMVEVMNASDIDLEYVTFLDGGGDLNFGSLPPGVSKSATLGGASLRSTELYVEFTTMAEPRETTRIRVGEEWSKLSDFAGKQLHITITDGTSATLTLK